MRHKYSRGPVPANSANDDIGNCLESGASAYEPNSLNQYMFERREGGSIRQFGYDSYGNMATDGEFTYSWDGENRLVSVCDGTGALVVSNAYDFMGRRVVKITPEATTTFFYDEWSLIEEHVAVTGSSSVSTNRYVWGKDPSGTMHGAGGVGGLVAVSLGGEWYFPLYDHNGNIGRLRK